MDHNGVNRWLDKIRPPKILAILTGLHLLLVGGFPSLPVFRNEVVAVSPVLVSVPIMAIVWLAGSWIYGWFYRVDPRLKKMEDEEKRFHRFIDPFAATMTSFIIVIFIQNIAR